MLKQYKTMIILTLCMLTLVSVGFSSWIVTTPSATIDADGYLEADSIIDNRKYFTSTTSEVFRYDQYSFKTENGAFTDVGIIKVNYTINLLECKNYFEKMDGKCSSLVLEVKSKYDDNISASYYVFRDDILNVTYKVEENSENYVNSGLTSTNTENQNISKLTLTDLTNNSFSISFKYTFTIPSGSTFNKGIYSGLLQNNQDKEIFAFSAKLTNNG